MPIRPPHPHSTPAPGSKASNTTPQTPFSHPLRPSLPTDPYPPLPAHGPRPFPNADPRKQIPFKTYARRVRIVSTVTTADMATNNPKITVSATVTLQEGPVAIDGSVSWGTSETVSITGFAELEIVAQ